ncbi:MAG TPA: 6,7-dimethyl-8-ribityllumazine synthase [Chitinophagaceae bacterium]|nr:6,7-dimethyl-8-ribityllumazine synthase [Chitinophagaceae bacterium]
MAITDPKLFDINTGILQKDACIIIVRTEWNAPIVDKLEEGCLRILAKYEMENYKVITVPGAFEIPFAIKSFWENTPLLKPNAFIALGCVLRGDTPHFDYVCKAVTDGVAQLNLSLPIPTIFGVLTVDNDKQAQDRVGGVHGNKGEEAAISALKMIGLQQSFYSKK